MTPTYPGTYPKDIHCSYKFVGKAIVLISSKLSVCRNISVPKLGVFKWEFAFEKVFWTERNENISILIFDLNKSKI